MLLAHTMVHIANIFGHTHAQSHGDLNNFNVSLQLIVTHNQLSSIDSFIVLFNWVCRYVSLCFLVFAYVLLYFLRFFYVFVRFRMFLIKRYLCFFMFPYVLYVLLCFLMFPYFYYALLCFLMFTFTCLLC